MAAGRAFTVVLTSSALLLAVGELPEECDAAAAATGKASCRKSLVQRGYNIAGDLQEGELEEQYLQPRSRYLDGQSSLQEQALGMSRHRGPSSSDWFESYSKMDAGRDLPELEPQAPRPSYGGRPSEPELEGEVPAYSSLDRWAETDAEELTPELAEAMESEAMAAARLPDLPGHAWQRPWGSSRGRAKRDRSEELAASLPAELQLQGAAGPHTPKAPASESGIRPALLSVVNMADKVHDAWVRTPVASSMLAIRHKVLGSTVEVHREAMVQGLIVVSMSFVLITMVAGSVIFMAASGKR